MKIFRFEVPVDSEWHAVVFAGLIVHVDCRRPELVEFWAPDDGSEKVVRRFRVFGTGQPVPDGCAYVGTALTPDPRGELVWHLFEQMGSSG